MTGQVEVSEPKEEDIAILDKNIGDFVEHFPELGLRKGDIMKAVHRAGAEIEAAVCENVRVRNYFISYSFAVPKSDIAGFVYYCSGNQIIR